MKKLLSILGILFITGTSTTSLIACNKQYSEDELKKEKEKNNITTKDGVLEWIASQEKPFDNVDNKWYYVVWRGNKNNDYIKTVYRWNLDTKELDLIVDNDGTVKVKDE